MRKRAWWGWSAAWFALCSGRLVAEAQVPAPPSSYQASASSTSIEAVLSPLVAEAERDVAAGRASWGLARAEASLRLLPAGSALRVRAEGVRLVATSALAGAVPEAVPVDVVYLPLVEEAERDLAAGARDVALARLELVVSNAPGGTLGVRASGLRLVAQQGTPAAPVEPAVPPAPSAPPTLVVGRGAALAAPATGAQGAAYVGPSGVPVNGLVEPVEAPPTTPADPTRRGSGEMVELYITGAILGTYVGFWIPFAAGLQVEPSGSGSSSGESLVYSLSVLAGGGLFALGAAGLDANGGLRTGVGPAMSVGMRYGLLSGFLMWGAADRAFHSASDTFDPVTGRLIATGRLGLVERTAMPFAFGLGGLLLGAAVGFGTEPSTDQVRFVETGGLWGTSLGFLIAIGAAQSGDAGFGATLGGLGAGLATTAIMTAAGFRISTRRSWMLSLGFLVGAAGGAVVPAITSSVVGGFSRDVFAGVTTVTSIAGLIVAGLLTEGMDAPRAASAERGLDVRLSVAPMNDGLLGTATGTF